MRILLTGATGFIGSRIAEALARAGHDVVCAVRDPSKGSPSFHYLAADFTRDFDAAVWLPRLHGIDAVVNAVGIIREQGTQTFDAIHHRAACALFAACAQAGIKRVVQVSALGADEKAVSRYHLSKKQADDFLAALPVNAAIVQPALVFGPGGASAKLFATLASLPVIGLPGKGEQQVQPVHVDDVVDAIVSLLLERTDIKGRVPLAGPQAMSLKTFLAKLKQAMGLGPARFVPIPMPLARASARLAGMLAGSLLDAETLQMLERGNTGDAGPMKNLLGRPPRPVEHFIAKPERYALVMQARLNWLLPILRVSIALVWIVTGIVSLGIYPVADSYALLARVGVTGMLAPVMLYGAALMDLALGVAILVLRRRYWLWIFQLALILFYTAVITLKLPEFWLHPYGPLLKNLPMLAAIWLLLEMEKR